MGLFTGTIFGVFWPEILWTLLKMTGYAVIGLTFCRGREFVNSTLFQWSAKMGFYSRFYLIWRIASGGT